MIEDGKEAQLKSGVPTWSHLELAPTGDIALSLYSALLRNQSDSSMVTGVIRFVLDPGQIAATFSDSLQSGIEGIFVTDTSGLLLASTLENVTITQTVGNTTQEVPVSAEDSAFSIVTKSFNAIPAGLAGGETKIFTLDGYAIAVSKLVTEYNLEGYVVVLGDLSWFQKDYHTSALVSGLTLMVSLVLAALGVALVTAGVWRGLKSIQCSLRWLQDDQTDGTSLVLRGEDGEYDAQAISQVYGGGYRLQVWFKEMDEIGEVLDDLALSNRLINSFSVFLRILLESLRCFSQVFLWE